MDEHCTDADGFTVRKNSRKEGGVAYREKMVANMYALEGE